MLVAYAGARRLNRLVARLSTTEHATSVFIRAPKTRMPLPRLGERRGTESNRQLAVPTYVHTKTHCTRLRASSESVWQRSKSNCNSESEQTRGPPSHHARYHATYLGLGFRVAGYRCRYEWLRLGASLWGSLCIPQFVDVGAPSRVWRCFRRRSKRSSRQARYSRAARSTLALRT